MAEPPAEIHEGERERPVQRGGEQDEPDDDREVGGAAGEQEGVGGADGEGGEERQADGEQQPRGRRSRGRHARHEPGLEHADDADDDDRNGDRTLECDHVGDRPRRVQLAHTGEREHGRTDGQRGGAGERDDAVVTDEHAGGHKPVDGEQRRHDREAARHDDGARVAAASADREQRHGGCRSHEGADADAVEVHPQRRHHHRAAPLPEDDDRNDGGCREKEQCRFREAAVHLSAIGQIALELKITIGVGRFARDRGVGTTALVSWLTLVHLRCLDISPDTPYRGSLGGRTRGPEPLGGDATRRWEGWFVISFVARQGFARSRSNSCDSSGRRPDTFARTEGLAGAA